MIRQIPLSMQDFPARIWEIQRNCIYENLCPSVAYKVFAVGLVSPALPVQGSP